MSTSPWINQLLQNLPLDHGDYGFLISRDGTYIAHPIKDFVMNETVFSVADERHNPDLRRLSQRMLKGEKGIIPFVSYLTDKPAWLSYSPIPSTHWAVAINLSQRRMLDDLHDLSQRKIIMGAVWMILLLLVLLFVARSITRPLKRLEGSAKTLATGDLDSNIPETGGQDEIATLARTFDKMRTDLKQYMVELSQTVARKERIESELRIAHDIQMSLVPKTFPAFPQRHDMDLFAAMDPAFDVGGDFYDFFLVDDSRLFLVIGDVSGKGVPAALHMAVTRSMLRSTFHGQITLYDAISRINNELSQNNDACMFVTLFSAVMHLDSGLLEYVNAGHNLPVLVDAEGQVEILDGQHGPAPGMIEGIHYDMDEYQLRPGQALFLYTDGVTEAMNPAKDLFGEQAMQALLKEARGKSCEQILHHLRQALRDFAQDAEQSDDITMMALRWLGPAAHHPDSHHQV